MTDDERRVTALAALFARDRAASLVARLPGDVAVEAAREAARLAAAPRDERLDALREAMAPAPLAGRAASVAALERPAVARVLLAVADGAADAASPLLVRLCRERVGR